MLNFGKNGRDDARLRVYVSLLVVRGKSVEGTCCHTEIYCKSKTQISKPKTSQPEAQPLISQHV